MECNVIHRAVAPGAQLLAGCCAGVWMHVARTTM